MHWAFAVLLFVSGWWGETGLPVEGRADYYAPGVMEMVYANRLAMGDVQPCVECIGNVALMRAGDVGRQVWLERPGQEREGPFLVVDCAERRHFEMRLAKGSVLEVDWLTARRWRMSGPITVTVYAGPAVRRTRTGVEW